MAKQEKKTKILKKRGWTIATLFRGRWYLDEKSYRTKAEACDRYDFENCRDSYEEDFALGICKAVRCTITAEVEV